MAPVLAPRAAVAQSSILPPDAAAREYRAGRDAVRARDFPEAIRRLTAALATGHDRPAERLGTARYSVERYDPDYWLGVAYMESGDDLRARLHLTRSRGSPLVQGWPEYADLVRRLAELDRRGSASRTPAVEPPATPTRTATPTAPPAPEPTPTAGVLEPGPPPAPSPTADPPVPARRPPPEAPLPAEETAAVIAAISRGRWDDARGALGVLRSRSPGHPGADLLEAVLEGSSYLLSGRSDEQARRRARAALEAYRRKGGSAEAEDAWVSPALRAALGL